MRACKRFNTVTTHTRPCWGLLVSLGALAFVACTSTQGDGLGSGDDDSDPSGNGPQDSTPARCSDLTQALVDHACIHAEDGPFDSADRNGDSVSKTHTYYTVALADDGSTNRLQVRYAPRRSGLFALLTDRSIDIEAETPSGRKQSLECAQRLTTADCSGLNYVYGLDLEDGVEYELDLQSDSADEVSLVFEFFAEYR